MRNREWEMMLLMLLMLMLLLLLLLMLLIITTTSSDDANTNNHDDNHHNRNHITTHNTLPPSLLKSKSLCFAFSTLVSQLQRAHRGRLHRRRVLVPYVPVAVSRPPSRQNAMTDRATSTPASLRLSLLLWNAHVSLGCRHDSERLLYDHVEALP